MNIKRVKQGSKITLFNGIYIILFGLYYIIFSNFNLKSSFRALALIWQIFEKYNPKIAELLSLLNFIIGILLIAIGIFIIYLSYYILKRKDKITWVVLFISGIIAWAGLLTINIFVKNIFLIALSIIGWFIFIIGMILPIRYYLEKTYREY